MRHHMIRVILMTVALTAGLSISMATPKMATTPNSNEMANRGEVQDQEKKVKMQDCLPPFRKPRASRAEEQSSVVSHR